jgi:hypothetical protein
MRAICNRGVPSGHREISYDGLTSLKNGHFGQTKPVSHFRHKARDARPAPGAARQGWGEPIRDLVGGGPYRARGIADMGFL